MACRVPMYCANSSSKRSNSSPRTKSERSSTSRMAACISVAIAAYCACKSTSGTFIRRSFPQPQPEQEDGPQDAPPSGDGPHLGVALGVGRIDFGHRDFPMPVAELDGLIEQIGFELVLVQPVLAPADACIAQDRRAKGAEAVRRFGHPLADTQRKQKWMHVARGQDAIRGRIPVASPGQEA